MRRRTKIICTIGPATASFEGLKALYEAGMDIVRINMSHSDHESAAKIINWIKTLNRQVNYPVPVLLDTQGPEIRSRAAPRIFGQGSLTQFFKSFLNLFWGFGVLTNRFLAKNHY